MAASPTCSPESRRPDFRRLVRLRSSADTASAPLTEDAFLSIASAWRCGCRCGQPGPAGCCYWDPLEHEDIVLVLDHHRDRLEQGNQAW